MRQATSKALALGILVTLLALPALTFSGTAWADEALPSEASAEATEEAPSEPIAQAAVEAEAAVAIEAEAEEAAAPPPAANADDELGYTINTLIMFLCAVLVLFMQAGFAMVEVGLNAAKNTVNILFKNLMDLAVGVLLFFIVGYNLMYPGADHTSEYLGKFVVGVAERTEAPSAGNWSPYADFLFQVAFAATAATIVSGAVAGRMRFEAYLIYSAIITGLVYPISGMWKWGGGFLNEAGFADFAGSVVVHAVGGFASLAGAIVLGPRLGRFVGGKSIPIPGHNLSFAALGVFILWVGWYGFNPGSQLTYAGAANADATAYIGVTTTLAAAAGTCAALILAWFLFKKPDLSMALNGALGGLVGITANCDQVTLPHAMLIGAIAGVIVVLGVVLLEKLRIDDPVGAFPVHGLCGVWGGIATGLFGFKDPSLWVQTYSTLIVCAWSFFTMLAVFGALRALGILRVSPEEEQAGLDISEHGMHAYPPQLVVDHHYGTPSGVSINRPTPQPEPVGAH